MKVFAVVPVKRLKDSKRRLSELLSPAERRTLTFAMLEDVLAALRTSTVNETVVVSEDEEMGVFAKKKAIGFLLPADSALNASLEEASEWCIKRGAGSLMILPADIPLVSSKDVDAVVHLGLQRTSVVVAPSRNGGTNALFQNPPKLVPACFGAKSFRKHINAAQCRDVEFRIYCSNGLVLDVDSTDDLKRVCSAKNQTQCKATLTQFARDNQKIQAFLDAKS